MFIGFLTLMGLAGLLSMTYLFPALAGLYLRFDRRRSTTGFAPASRLYRPCNQRQWIAILIPAFNEETHLALTLQSLNHALLTATDHFSSLPIELRPSFTIHVGADGCTDSTATVAKNAGAQVTSFKKQQGKWKTLQALLSPPLLNHVDWVILADAGIIWDENFLIHALTLSGNPKLMAIAPTYRSPRAGIFGRLSWALERHLKKLESSIGGPVSVHGATIMYRSPELRQALAFLGDHAWLNDDVVLPLALRACFPDLKIAYAAQLSVLEGSDPAHETKTKKAQPSASREFIRRRRMIVGNIQWIRVILPKLFSKNVSAGILAFRRISRMLWAYWALLALAGFFLMLPLIPALTLFASSLLAMGIILKFFRAAASPILAPARASLLVPYYLLTHHESKQRTVWR